jgi:hypothetical protein
MPPALFLDRVAFVDVEASAWPAEGGVAIEVAVACDDAATRSWLIRPPAALLPLAWSAKAEAVHGIARARLDAEGASAEAVCAALNDALRGRTVFSDNPAFDAAWLGPVFAAAGAQPGFSLRHAAHAWDAFDCASDLTLLWEEASRAVPQAHRAGPDAERLLMVWRLARARWEAAPCRWAP